MSKKNQWIITSIGAGLIFITGGAGVTLGILGLTAKGLAVGGFATATVAAISVASALKNLVGKEKQTDSIELNNLSSTSTNENRFETSSTVSSDIDVTNDNLNNHSDAQAASKEKEIASSTSTISNKLLFVISNNIGETNKLSETVKTESTDENKNQAIDDNSSIFHKSSKDNSFFHSSEKSLENNHNKETESTTNVANTEIEDFAFKGLTNN